MGISDGSPAAQLKRRLVTLAGAYVRADERAKGDIVDKAQALLDQESGLREGGKLNLWLGAIQEVRERQG